MIKQNFNVVEIIFFISLVQKFFVDSCGHHKQIINVRKNFRNCIYESTANIFKTDYNESQLIMEPTE